MAEYLLVNLYPLAIVNEALANQTEQFLKNAEFASKPALKRIIVENLANVHRALSAQNMDKKS
jgi:aminopeptidase N